MFYFLGIDIGGKNNTWIVTLKKEEKCISLEPLFSIENPSNPSPFRDLSKLIEFVKNFNVLGAGIDAPLSFSLTNPHGFRKSDEELKTLLASFNAPRTWVVSYHSLMAIPIRAFLLAEALSPYCGSIIETHPRANLYFCLPEEKRKIAYIYKKKGSVIPKEEQKFLISWIQQKFQISLPSDLNFVDGILDAIFCAIAVLLYHISPERLKILSKKEKNLKGYGPFVIVIF